MFTFKIINELDHQLFQECEKFEGNEKDLIDGFIHMCSTQEQVNKIIQKRYLHQLIRIYELFFDDDIIKMENVNGEDYPHLYDRPILIENVVSISERILSV